MTAVSRHLRSTLALLLLPWLICACGDRKDAPDGTTPEHGHTWSFATETAGSLPAGFRVSQGTWAVAETPVGRGLLQSARNDNPVFNVVLIDEPVLADVDVAVDVRALDGSFDQGGGPAWRARNGSNYYVARWNPLEHNIRVYHVKDGVRTELASADTQPGTMQRRLRVVMQGPRIRCWLAGVLLLELEDGTFPDAGRVGLWAKADARTLFQAFEVRAP